MSTTSLRTESAVKFTLERAWILSLAAAAIILGIVALVWPDVTLRTISLIFGTYLILAGIYRIVLAFASRHLSTLMKWSTGVLGAFVVLGGILTLNNSFGSLAVMTYVIGVAWILSGITDLMGGWRGSYPAPRWLILLGGVLSILAGFAVMLVVDLAIGTFVIVAGLLLIVVGIGVAITLPDLVHRIASASAQAAATAAAKDAADAKEHKAAPATGGAKPAADTKPAGDTKPVTAPPMARPSMPAPPHQEQRGSDRT